MNHPLHCMRRPSRVPAGALLAAILLPACEDTLSADPFVSDAEFMAALPHRADHTLAVARSTDAARSTPPPDEHEDSDGWFDLYGLSVQVATDLNSLTLTCLLLVDEVVTYPPSYRAADARRWGPVDVDGDFTIALHMHHSTAGYDWDFRAAPTGTDTLPSICAGTHDPGTQELARGTGVIDIWLEHWDTTDTTVGTITSAYDLTDGQEVRMTLSDVSSDGERAEDGSYYYRQHPTGGGDFQYRTTLLLDDGVDAILEVRTRWQAGGAGRSDARLIADAYPRAYRFSECFEPGGRPVYRWTDIVRGAVEGEPSDCTYSSPAAVDQI